MMAGPGMEPRDFRDGVMLELEDELRNRCIIYGETAERGKIQIGIELTDRARILLGMWVMAAEITERQAGDR